VSAPHPVFIGGTGRSGTTVLGELLGEHSQYYDLETELVFHAAEGGLPDLISGRVSVDRFIEKLRTQWWYTLRPETAKIRERGLHRIIPEERFEAALTALPEAVAEDRVRGAREFLYRLVQPLAEEQNKPYWIETTPYNPFYGHALLELCPEMKLIHTVRDGRDVASSVAAIYFGPDEPIEALRYWDTRMRLADAGCRGLSDDHLMVVTFEDLFNGAREETYARILEFVGIEDEPRMRAYFESKMSPEAAHIGRWRNLRFRERADLDFVYQGVLLRMHRDRLGCAPALDPEWDLDPEMVSDTVAGPVPDAMRYRVHMVYSAPRSEQEAVSPLMTQEEAQAELRAIRRLRDDGAEIVRAWAFIPPDAIVGAHISEDRVIG
jgi:Sulfotransferase family